MRKALFLITLGICLIYSIACNKSAQTQSKNAGSHPYAGEHRPAGVMLQQDMDILDQIKVAGRNRDSSKFKIAADALYHPRIEIRRSAALALGRIGSSEALPLLDTAAHCPDLDQSDVMTAIHVAQARIRANSTTPDKRIDFFLSELGLSQQEVSSPSNSKPVRGLKPGEAFVAREAISEMLAEMIRQGNSVKYANVDFGFDKAQQWRVEYAGLPPHDKAEQIVSYLCDVPACTMEAYAVAQLLVEDGPPATAVVIERLKKITKHPDSKHPGYDLLIRVATASGDKSVLPVLREIAACNMDSASSEARYAIHNMENGRCNHSVSGDE